MEKLYIIRRGTSEPKQWWKEGDQGYTTNAAAAKRFTHLEALEIIQRVNSDKTMHLLTDIVGDPKNYVVTLEERNPSFSMRVLVEAFTRHEAATLIMQKCHTPRSSVAEVKKLFAYEWFNSEDRLPDPDKTKRADEIEVIGYHPKWVHPDFNPQGIRVCFYNPDHGWYSAFWCNDHDCYHTASTDTVEGLYHEMVAPEKWAHRPNAVEIIPTYRIHGDVSKSIECLMCGCTSHHPKDVEQVFCVNCGYHEI